MTIRTLSEWTVALFISAIVAAIALSTISYFIAIGYHLGTHTYHLLMGF